jgi:hypothetical protein
MTPDTMRQVVLMVLLAELLAAAGARQRPTRDGPQPRGATPPRRKRQHVPRGALAGRRPRG